MGQAPRRAEAPAGRELGRGGPDSQGHRLQSNCTHLSGEGARGGGDGEGGTGRGDGDGGRGWARLAEVKEEEDACVMLPTVKI